MKLITSHCLKVKMNGKKLSKFQFHFTGLLATSLMLRNKKMFYNWTTVLLVYY